MSKWAELPLDLLRTIARKQTNYVHFVWLRAVCKSWRSAIPSTPQNSLCQLPWLLLPYHQNDPSYRGFYNLSDNKTYCLELAEAFEKRCCGSSHGWLIMIDESLTISLLNPLTKAFVHLPPLTTFPTFPTQVVAENSRNLNEHFIKMLRFRLRDTFIVKAILSADPSLTSPFTLIAIYGIENRKLGFCKSGDVAWSIIPDKSLSRYEDVVYHAGQFYAVDQLGRVSICSVDQFPPQLTLIADPPLGSHRTNSKRWYLAGSSDELLLLARHRKVVPNYDYRTDSFEVFKLDWSRSSWLKMEDLGDRIIFLGGNCSLVISARDYWNRKGNCIYFTDDCLRICTDYAWEGHDFGVFDFDKESAEELGLPPYPIKLPPHSNVFCYESSLNRHPVLFLPPPLWVTISPSQLNQVHDMPL